MYMRYGCCISADAMIIGEDDFSDAIEFELLGIECTFRLEQLEMNFGVPRHATQIAQTYTWYW